MWIKDLLAQIDKMSLEEIEDLQILSQKKKQKDNLSSSDKRVLLKEISSFREFDVQFILRRILVYSIWCPDEAIEVARKKGVFRYKAWGLKDNKAELLLQNIRRYYSVIHYSESTKQFINTKLSLSWMFTFYQKSEKYLVYYIKKHHTERKRIRVDKSYVEEALFKELLAYADTLFYLYKRNRNSINKNQLDGYSHEEICESISYLVYLYDATIGIKDDCHYTVSSK